MLKLAYVGIAFSLVFYVVFGLAVRFMELSDKSRNKARLGILLTSMIIFAISGITAGVLNIKIGLMIYGVGFLILSFVAVVVTGTVVLFAGIGALSTGASSKVKESAFPQASNTFVP